MEAGLSQGARARVTGHPSTRTQAPTSFPCCTQRARPGLELLAEHLAGTGEALGSVPSTARKEREKSEHQGLESLRTTLEPALVRQARLRVPHSAWGMSLLPGGTNKVKFCLEEMEASAGSKARAEGGGCSPRPWEPFLPQNPRPPRPGQLASRWERLQARVDEVGANSAPAWRRGGWTPEPWAAPLPTGPGAALISQRRGALRPWGCPAWALGSCTLRHFPGSGLLPHREVASVLGGQRPPQPSRLSIFLFQRAKLCQGFTRL